MIKIAPSILSADFSALREECQAMEAAGADWLHIDVMDGHFVPNLTFGAPVVKCLRPHATLPFDVHLMISNPLQYVVDFVQAGADLIAFHAESDSPIDQTIAAIRESGVKAGLVVKPNTPAEMVLPFLSQLDMVVVMTVEPGFGGQKFRQDVLPKIREIRNEITRLGLSTELEIDGGINPDTIALAAEAGANVFVAGNAVFGADNPGEMIASLRQTAQNAYDK